MIAQYPVVTLCGSTRFKEQFLDAQKRLTIAGNIIINVGGYIGQGKRVEYLEEKTSNPCFCAIYFLSLRNLWIVRHERI